MSNVVGGHLGWDSVIGIRAIKSEQDISAVLAGHPKISILPPSIGNSRQFFRGYEDGTYGPIEIRLFSQPIKWPPEVFSPEAEEKDIMRIDVTGKSIDDIKPLLENLCQLFGASTVNLTDSSYNDLNDQARNNAIRIHNREENYRIWQNLSTLLDEPNCLEPLMISQHGAYDQTIKYFEENGVQNSIDLIEVELIRRIRGKYLGREVTIAQIFVHNEKMYGVYGAQISSGEDEACTECEQILGCDKSTSYVSLFSAPEVWLGFGALLPEDSDCKTLGGITPHCPKSEFIAEIEGTKAYPHLSASQREDMPFLVDMLYTASFK